MAAILGMIGLAGCAGSTADPNRTVSSGGSSETYDCNDGKVVHVVFDGLEAVMVEHEGKVEHLRAVPSTTGATYQGGTTTLRRNGKIAELVDDAGTIRCIIRP